jgi:hypothetical protein
MVSPRTEGLRSKAHNIQPPCQCHGGVTGLGTQTMLLSSLSSSDPFFAVSPG